MIEVGKFAGFCGGVTNSVKKTEKALNELKKVSCLGELVHNKQVVNSLEEKGLIVIDNINEIEDNSNVIIRAHGIPKEVYDIAKTKNINLIDLTCPKVLKIHDKVEEYKNKNYFIILVGSKIHPEVIGTISFCGEKSIVIESLDDLKENTNLISKYNDIVVFAQTTYKESLFNEIVEYIKDNINKNIVVENTICDATHLRQEECKNMSQNNDCMIIIGGKNSSNTKKLYEVSKEYCSDTYLIETVDELDIERIKKYNKIGIMAGASTPKTSIDEVIKKIS